MRYPGCRKNPKTGTCDFHVLAYFYKGFSYEAPRSADCCFPIGFSCFSSVDLEAFETGRKFAFHLAMSGGAAQIIVLSMVFNRFRRIHLASCASKRHVSESHLICPLPRGQSEINDLLAFFLIRLIPPPLGKVYSNCHMPLH